MTTFYPDISSFQAGLSLTGAAAVCVKATEYTNYTDPYYAGWENEAASKGILFSAYHYLRSGNGSGQADYCHSVVGNTPVMLDVETGSGNMTDILAFRDRLQAIGGRLWGVYLPKWYWQQIGSPDLSGLGCALVASDYTTYSDNGPGWNSYGGVTPAVWQYTDTQSFNGQQVDFNAFEGTVSQLQALWYGAPPPPPPPNDEDDDMAVAVNGYAGLAFAPGSVKSAVVQIDPGDPANSAVTQLRSVVWETSGPLSPVFPDFSGGTCTVHFETTTNPVAGVSVVALDKNSAAVTGARFSLGKGALS